MNHFPNAILLIREDVNVVVARTNGPELRLGLLMQWPGRFQRPAVQRWLRVHLICR